MEELLSWKKIECNNRKIGFREGAQDGKENNFQKSFDRGYRDGFHNGFLMGKYKGKIKIADLKDNRITKEKLLENTRKGWCCICNDNHLLEKSIEEIRQLENQSLTKLLENLCIKYDILDLCLE